MALVVQKNVAIVPIFNLDEVGNNAICRAALHKVALSCQKFLGIGSTKFVIEVSQEATRVCWSITHLFFNLCKMFI